VPGERKGVPKGAPGYFGDALIFQAPEKFTIRVGIFPRPNGTATIYHEKFLKGGAIRLVKRPRPADRIRLGSAEGGLGEN